MGLPVYTAAIHAARPPQGQQLVAANMRRLLADSAN